MIGTFTEETASVAHFSCFGRHGRLDAVTVRALATEIIGLFTHSEYRQHFATEGQAAMQAAYGREAQAERIGGEYQHATPGGSIVRPPQRITAILPNDLRELLFTLPAISALRSRYPLTKITLMGTFAHHALLEQMPCADRVVEKPKHIREWPHCLLKLWQQRPDLCLSFADDFASAFFTVASCASQRIGFADGGGSLFFSDHVQTRMPASPQRALLLLNSLGLFSGESITPPSLLPGTQETVKLSLLAAGIDYNDPIILLCPHADETRAWPMEHWIALAGELLESRPERIAVLGAQHIAWPDGVVKVMPIQDSLMLATLIARTSLVIAPDTAPLHLADLLGIPTIGFYGLNDPAVHSLPNALRLQLCDQECLRHPSSKRSMDFNAVNTILPGDICTAVADLLDTAVLTIAGDCR